MTNQIWRVGDVEITKLVEAEFTFPSENTGKIIPDADPTSVLTIPWIGPFATPEGKLRGSVHLLLVQTPCARIIVDTGIGNDKTRDLPLFSMRTTPVLDFLHAAGWSRESVDHVICTHLHLDTLGGTRSVETTSGSRRFRTRSITLEAVTMSISTRRRAPLGARCLPTPSRQS